MRLEAAREFRVFRRLLCKNATVLYLQRGVALYLLPFKSLKGANDLVHRMIEIHPRSYGGHNSCLTRYTAAHIC